MPSVIDDDDDGEDHNYICGYFGLDKLVKTETSSNGIRLVELVNDII